MNTQNKQILTDIETLNLLTSFFHEALIFLNVPQNLWPNINMDTADLGHFVINSIPHLNYQSNTITVNISALKNFAGIKTNFKNDGPTIYRIHGYKLARIWQTYLNTGKQLEFLSDKDSYIFSVALMMIKGISENTIFRNEALIMLRDEFGIPCRILNAYDVANKCNSDFVTLTAEEHNQRFKTFSALRRESNKMQLPQIADGELGSKSNPFNNVDDAAKYILNIEKDRLANDRYRQTIKDEQFYYDLELGYFRISWASANVSYYSLESANSPYFVVNQLSLQPNQIGISLPRFSIKPSLANNKFLFRGQSEFYSPCRPNLFRDKKKNAERQFVDDIIQMNELEILLRQHPLVKLFENGFYLVNEFFRFKIDYAGLAQHYYNRTPLLDLTSDMEVAKFFAVTWFDMENDCYRKYTGNELGVLYYYDLAADAFNIREGRHYHIDTIGKQPFMRSGNQAGFLINLNINDDFNQFPEVRYVFFKHSPTITDRIFKDSHNGDKYMPQELLRTHWHKRMNDKNALKEISYEALKLNFKNNPHISHSSIVKILHQKGFHICSKNKQFFTEEELDSYYAGALDFWEEFCSNIYFYGPEGALLKEHLRRLPQDPRYSWAFKK